MEQNRIFRMKSVGKKIKEEFVTRTGIITPCQWDEDDAVTAVMFSSTADEEFLVENGEKFMDHFRETIRVTGMVKQAKRSFKTISIRNFDIL